MMKNVAKKWIAFCMAVILLAGSVSSVSQAKVNGYFYKYKGVSVTIDSAAKKFLSKAGKPLKKKVTKSCAYKGKDRTYQYADFILTTYSHTDNGAEYVLGITFRNDKVSTMEGIKIGSSESDVFKKYGKTKDNFGIFTYTKGNTKLQIEITDGKVTKIRYISKKIK